MIGAFARMLGSRERILSVEENERGYALKARDDHGGDSVRDARDTPPEGFVEKISDEGGDVYMSPIVEAWRHIFRRKPTVSSMAEKVQTSSEAQE